MLIPMLAGALLGELLKLARAVLAAAVPLAFGVLCAVVAAGLYVWLLTGRAIPEFFSSAAQVGVGVLVALMLERVISQTDNWLVQRIRTGTVALTAMGTGGALVGLLISESEVARGVMFSLTWGGISAGVVGLFVFVGTGPQAGAVPSARMGEKTDDAPESDREPAAL